eukprot:380255-Prymnesium_polylepis.1
MRADRHLLPELRDDAPGLSDQVELVFRIRQPLLRLRPRLDRARVHMLRLGRLTLAAAGRCAASWP